MTKVFGIKVKGYGRSFETRPKEFSTLNLVIEGERMKKLSDLIVEDILERVHSILDTCLVGSLLLDIEDLLNGFQLGSEG